MDSTDVRQSRPRDAAAPERPLLSQAVRPWAAWVLVACAVIVPVLGALLAHQTRANVFDRAVDAPIIRAFSDHQVTAYWLGRPGSELPAFLMVVAIVAVCLLKCFEDRRLMTFRDADSGIAHGKRVAPFTGIDG